jgi:hypothetical protein
MFALLAHAAALAPLAVAGAAGWSTVLQAPPGQAVGLQAAVQQAAAVPGPAEAQAPPTVGNLGRAANPGPRRLRVSHASRPGAAARPLQLLQLPPETRAGDACSIVDVSELQVQGPLLRITLDHQFACGAGAATQARYVLRRQGAGLVLTQFTLEASSREGHFSTQLDYVRQRLVQTQDRPEDEQPAAARVRPLGTGPQPVRADSLLRCPKPFRPGWVPNCRW